jgi:hypothetical protein
LFGRQQIVSTGSSSPSSAPATQTAIGNIGYVAAVRIGVAVLVAYEKCEAATPTYRPILTTLAWTGLRVSEALGFRWEDIDFEERQIRVEFQLDENGSLKRPA